MRPSSGPLRPPHPALGPVAESSDAAAAEVVANCKVAGGDAWAVRAGVNTATAVQMDPEMVELDALMKRSDFISLHCPQIPDTEGFINRARLSLVTPGSYLVNLARGGVIESLDLLQEMLDNGRLGGAALAFASKNCSSGCRAACRTATRLWCKSRDLGH